jgi:hypothetical protein
MIASFEPHKGTFFPLFECHTAVIITATGSIALGTLVGLSF